MLQQSLFMLLVATMPCVAADVQVIANKDCTTTTVSSDDLADFYLGKKTKWRDGTKAVVLTNANSDETETFLVRYLDKTSASFSAAWKRIVFTGKGSPPAEAKDDQEMIDLVKKTPGAIGYVSASIAVEGVVALKVTK